MNSPALTGSGSGGWRRPAGVHCCRAHDALQAPRWVEPRCRWGPLTIVTIGVLALQGDVREHLEAFRRSGAATVPVRLATELDTVDALAIPGGESTTMHRLLRVFGL